MLGIALGSTPQHAAPHWWPDGAAFAFDFTRGEAMVAGERFPAADLLVCQRTGSAMAPQRPGGLITFETNQPRITNRGLLVEDGRTNLLHDSFSPAQHDIPLPAGTFALSMLGGGQVGMSGALEGIATAQSPLIATLPAPGSVTVTPQGEVTFFQLEAGSFPTSPIATTAAPATRADEAVSLADPTLFDPQSSTILIEWEQVAPGATATNGVQMLLRWDAGGVWSRIRSGSIVYAQVQDAGGALVLNAGSGIPAPPGIHRIAVALAPNDMAFAWSASLDGMGGLVVDTSGVPVAPPAALLLGGTQGHERLNGWIRKVICWPGRHDDSTLLAFALGQ